MPREGILKATDALASVAVELVARVAMAEEPLGGVDAVLRAHLTAMAEALAHV